MLTIFPQKWDRKNFSKKNFSPQKWDLEKLFPKKNFFPKQNETWKKNFHKTRLNKIFQKFLFYKTRLRKSFDETKHFVSFYTRSDIES